MRCGALAKNRERDAERDYTAAAEISFSTSPRKKRQIIHLFGENSGGTEKKNGPHGGHSSGKNRESRNQREKQRASEGESARSQRRTIYSRNIPGNLP